MDAGGWFRYLGSALHQVPARVLAGLGLEVVHEPGLDRVRQLEGGAEKPGLFGEHPLGKGQRRNLRTW